MKIIKFIAIFLLLGFLSCQKEEIPTGNTKIPFNLITSLSINSRDADSTYSLESEKYGFGMLSHIGLGDTITLKDELDTNCFGIYEVTSDQTLYGETLGDLMHGFTHFHVDVISSFGETFEGRSTIINLNKYPDISSNWVMGRATNIGEWDIEEYKK